MPTIPNAEEAFKLSDRIFETWADWHERLVDWRALVDREMADTLESFAAILPPKLKEKWWPYQSPEVQNEAQNLAHILASNQLELEVISKSSDPTLLKLAQQLEEADEALIADLMDIMKRVLRYMALLTDGVAVEAIDIHEPGKYQKAYADRRALEAYADGEGDDDEDDDSPPAIYKRAYHKAGNNHQKAYAKVMQEAAMMDDLPVENRIVNVEHFAAEFDEHDNAQIGVERARIGLSSVVGMLEGYGVAKRGTQLVLTHQGKPTEGSALTSERTGTNSGSCLATDEIEYVQIRTMDEILIAIKGYQGDGAAGGNDGILIRVPNPFENSLGYIITTGIDKIRSLITKRMEPYLLPLMVETQILNALVSGMMAMAWAEASLEEYELEDEFPVQPIDSTGETKGASAPPGGPRKNVAAGEIKRLPTTGIDLAKMAEMTAARINEYRSREFFAGTGVAGESGRLVARIQTAQLTKLVPIQAKCSLADKQKLQIIHGWIRKSKRTLTIAQEPDLDKHQRGDSIQVAKPKEITPKHANLPVALRVTTGANTPEAEYAMLQMGMELLDRSIIGETTFRTEYLHAKDPQRLEELMIEDRLTKSAIAKGEGKMDAVIEARMQQIVDAILPPPPPPPTTDIVPPPALPGALPPPPTDLPGGSGGGGYIDPAVPHQEGGIPDVSGAGGLSV